MVCFYQQTCCPQYTIRLKSDAFKPTKNQKQVLKKLERYLHDDSVADVHDSHSTSKSANSSAIQVSVEHGQTQQSNAVQQTAAMSSTNSNEVDMQAAKAEYIMHILTEAVVAAIQCAVRSGTLRITVHSNDLNSVAIENSSTYWTQAAQVR
jgi:dihydroxyacetone kinase-like predicted kinase